MQYKDEYGFEFIKSKREYDKTAWIKKGRPSLSRIERAFIVGRQYKDKFNELLNQLTELKASQLHPA